MTGRFPVQPTLPPEAETEVMAVLSAKMRISSDELSTILKKHGVSGDVDALQDRYRKQVGQRLMAGIRDGRGQREVLAAGREYVVVECCNDLRKLQKIRHQLQGQISGLDNSASKVGGRVRILGRLTRRFRKAG